MSQHTVQQELQFELEKFDNILMPYIFFKERIKQLPKNLIEIEIGKHFNIEYLKEVLFYTNQPNFHYIAEILKVHLQNKISNDVNGLIQIPFNEISISRDIMNDLPTVCKSISYPIISLYTIHYNDTVKKINYLQQKITFLKTALDFDTVRALIKKGYKVKFYSSKARRFQFEIVKICKKIVKMKYMKYINNIYYTGKFQIKIADFVNLYLENSKFYIYIYDETMSLIDDYVKVNKLNVDKYI